MSSWVPFMSPKHRLNLLSEATDPPAVFFLTLDNDQVTDGHTLRMHHISPLDAHTYRPL